MRMLRPGLNPRAKPQGRALAVAAVLLLFVAGTGAVASDEHETLRAENRRLRAGLAAAEAEIRELRARLPRGAGPSGTREVADPGGERRPIRSPRTAVDAAVDPNVEWVPARPVPMDVASVTGVICTPR